MGRPSSSAVLVECAAALQRTAPAAAEIVVDSVTGPIILSSATSPHFRPLGCPRGSSIDVAAVDAPTVTIGRLREGASATCARVGATRA